MKRILTLIAILALGAPLFAQNTSSTDGTRECAEPTNLFADISGNNIKLSWISAPNAQSYYIYRNQTLLEEVSSEQTSFIDTKIEYNNEYCYQVSTLCANGEESLLSNEVCLVYNAPSLTFDVDTLWMTNDQAVLSISNFTEDAYVTLNKIALVDDDIPWYYFDYNENIFQLGQDINIDIAQGQTIQINVNANIVEKGMFYPVLRFINSYQEVRLVTAIYSTLSTNESSSNDIQVYPNPANDIVTVSGDKIETVDIFNVLGQKVIEYQTDENSINISTANLQNGIYFVRVNGERTMRLVVTH